MFAKWNRILEVQTFSGMEEAAEKTVDLLRSGNVALSGGSTYGSLFARWAALNPDCSGTRFFPVDERQVPLKDPASNWRKAYEDLLVPLHRTADLSHHASSAAAYKKILNSYFLGFLPVFDVVFLGMGEDGHTASLFPGGEYLDDDIEIVLETEAPSPPVKRVSLGPTVLTSAHQVVVIVAGKYKTWALKQFMEGNREIPLTRILEKREHSLLLLEESLYRAVEKERE